MREAAQLSSGLSNFHGTEQWFRHWCNKSMLYTEGVEYFAEHAGNGAYWFLDIVATELMPLLKKEPFLAVELSVADKVAVILADDGNGNEVYRRLIDYTDCPRGNWEFYLTDNTFLLRSEY